MVVDKSLAVVDIVCLPYLALLNIWMLAPLSLLLNCISRNLCCLFFFMIRFFKVNPIMGFCSCHLCMELSGFECYSFFVMICLEYFESVKQVHLLALFGFMAMRLHGGGLL